MITLERFLAAVQENVDRIHAYESGHDGSDGKCDCIGLIIGAVKLAGGSWPGVHGSNWAARNAMDRLNYIEAAGYCYIGEIVYKAKAPGDEGYNLPAAYKNNSDSLDYYHVGVVTSVEPLRITHCTNVAGGIKVDNTLGQWHWGGKLKYVDYAIHDVSDEPLYRAIVTADNGYPVKMRSQPSTNAQVIASVPLGTDVEVDDVLDGWSQIVYNGATGYMMSKFLSPVGTEGAIGNTVTVDKATLKAARAALKMALDAIDEVLEGGAVG